MLDVPDIVIKIEYTGECTRDEFESLRSMLLAGTHTTLGFGRPCDAFAIVPKRHAQTMGDVLLTYKHPTEAELALWAVQQERADE